MKEIFVLVSLVSTVYGSAKKGLCIPPGTNFHCGDLAAFHNARWVSVSVVGVMMTCVSVGGTTGTSLPTTRWTHRRTTAPAQRAPVVLFLLTRSSSPWSGDTWRTTGPGTTISTIWCLTSTMSSSASTSPTTPTSRTSPRRWRQAPG